MVGKGWEMVLSRRFAVLGAALLLCPNVGAAFADPTPSPVDSESSMTIECPAPEDVAAALGRQVTSNMVAVRECRYSASGAGPVLFRFEALTLAELRSAAESAGTTPTEVDDLTPGAFATTVGNNWVVRFQLGTETATLMVPTALQSGAVSLAEQFLAAGPIPVPSTSPPDERERPGMPGTGN